MIKIEELYEIYRLLASGKNKSEISRIQQVDRKTIREYSKLFEACEITYNKKQVELTEFAKKIADKLPIREKRKGKKEYIDKVKDKIEELFTKDTDLRIDTCYRIIKSKYNVNVSYETFRRYVMKEGMVKSIKKEYIRIELPAGYEIQMDYGKVGLLYDPLCSKERVVYAFIGTLSYSRLPYVEFVYTQNQQSFVMSFVNMFEYYGGVTDYISIDNLKSGVVKADLYEPTLNKTFSEMACHYGTVINPCRVKTPTDKGKVERMVPVVREQFKYLKSVYETANIGELNRKIQDWCRNEYGTRIHGTTREIPMQRFEEAEKEKLRPLTENGFTLSVWKTAKVHPDQFIQFEKKRYSLPPEYRGKYVEVQKKGDFISVFHDLKLIKTYKIPTGAVTYDTNHFPKYKVEMMDGSYSANILKTASSYGDVVCEYIRFVLSSNAYINARRAKGCLSVIEEYKNSNFLSSVCKQAKIKNVFIPSELKKMMESEKSQHLLFSEIPRSAEGESMLREFSYYI